MRLIELLARAADEVPRKDTYRRATAIVLRKWPHVRHFKDEQLTELCTELKGEKHETSAPV